MFSNIFFLVSTLNGMVGVLCSVIVNERLKMRKYLAINYWQDIISGVEVSNNVIKSTNFEEFQPVLWFCTIFHFNTIFSNSSKIEFRKNLGGEGGCSTPSPPGFYWPEYGPYILLLYVLITVFMRSFQIYRRVFE